MYKAEDQHNKLNSGIEVVAVHDNMPSILWARYFLEAQGYPMRPSVVHQDNQSAMLLEANERGSSSKRTRHMNIRYFFVADCQERNQIILTYCPTDEMIGDFFTKPLGGAKFRRFQNIIMNCDVDEYGPVNIDELMSRHYSKVDRVMEDDGSKKQAININTIKNNEPDGSITDTGSVGSQECVGNRTYSEWVVHRKTRRKVGGSKARPHTSPVDSQNHRNHRMYKSTTARNSLASKKKLSWADVVAVASE
jgi:hypothetical protein